MSDTCEKCGHPWAMHKPIPDMHYPPTRFMCVEKVADEECGCLELPPEQEKTECRTPSTEDYLRMAAVSACREVWLKLDVRQQEIVNVAWDFANGAATAEKMATTRFPIPPGYCRRPDEIAVQCASCSPSDNVLPSVVQCVSECRILQGKPGNEIVKAERERVAAIIDGVKSRMAPSSRLPVSIPDLVAVALNEVERQVLEK